LETRYGIGIKLMIVNIQFKSYVELFVVIAT